MAFSRIHLRSETTPFVLRGCAIPYGQTRIHCGVAEHIEPGTFRTQCFTQRNCDLQLDTHEHAAPIIASVAGGTLELFEGSDALYFEAHILPDIPIFEELEGVLRAGLFQACSVSFDSWDYHAEDRDGLEDVQVVTNGVIGHIALFENPNQVAYEAHTSCWNAAHELRLQGRLAYHAERWHAANAAHNVKPAPTKSGHTRQRPNVNHEVRPGLRLYSMADMNKLEQTLRRNSPRSGLGIPRSGVLKSAPADALRAYERAFKVRR